MALSDTRRTDPPNGRIDGEWGRTVRMLGGNECVAGEDGSKCDGLWSRKRPIRELLERTWRPVEIERVRGRCESKGDELFEESEVRRAAPNHAVWQAHKLLSYRHDAPPNVSPLSCGAKRRQLQRQLAGAFHAVVS